LKNIAKKNIFNKKADTWIWIVLAIGILIRLWLTESQSLFAIGNAGFDDRLFLELAKNILKGEWLGSYDALTLIKGPFFSLWVAFTYILKLPLLLSGQILYVLSCLLLVHSVKSIIGNKFLLLSLYFVLLFNPASFDASITRATREMIYPSLSILVVACSFGIFISTGNNDPTWYWGIGLGVTFGCFWITREEGIWILPFLLIVFIAGLALLVSRSWTLASFWRFDKSCLISLVLFILILNTINVLNYINYGIYAKTEMNAASFKAAYGALSRVKPIEAKRYVPVTKMTRRLIYEISPSFRELRGYFEGEKGQMWLDSGIGAGRDRSNRTEILGGWFMWAFRDAVSKSGYYDSGKYPDEYYLRLADEINHACEIGQLECLPERNTLAPVWNWHYVKYLIPSMTERLFALVKFDSISVDPIMSIGSNEQLLFFQNLTNENISPDTENKWNVFRISILKYILKIYQTLTPIMTIYSVIAFAISLFFLIKYREGVIQVVILTSLLVLILTRITLLSMIDITSWQLSLTAYLHPLHPFFLMFVFLAILGSIKPIRKILNNRWHRSL
jgi:hypothetical protein